MNPLVKLESLTKEEVESKIYQLQNRLIAIARSGNADIYNQLVSVLQVYTNHYNRVYRDSDI
jgi:hypothetical protein